MKTQAWKALAGLSAAMVLAAPVAFASDDSDLLDVAFAASGGAAPSAGLDEYGQPISVGVKAVAIVEPYPLDEYGNAVAVEMSLPADQLIPVVFEGGSMSHQSSS